MQRHHEFGSENSDAALDAGTAYEIVRELMPAFDALAPRMRELVESYNIPVRTARDMASGAAMQIAALADTSPWQELYANLLQLLHLAGVVRERYEHTNFQPQAAPTAYAAVAAMQQFLELLRLAMELEDLTARIAGGGSAVPVRQG